MVEKQASLCLQHTSSAITMSHCPTQDRRNLHVTNCLIDFLKRKVPHRGPSIGLCCPRTDIQNSRAALGGGSLSHCIHAKPPSLLPCLLHQCAHHAITGVAESRDWLTSTELFYTWLFKASAAMMSLLGMNVGCTNSVLCAPPPNSFPYLYSLTISTMLPPGP